MDESEKIELNGSVPISNLSTHDDCTDATTDNEPVTTQSETFEIPELDFSEMTPTMPHSSESPEEKMEKRKYIRKIGQYKTLFGSELAELDLRNLYLKSLSELTDLSETVEFMVSTRRSSKAVHGMFLGGISIMEMFAPKIGFDLEGITAVTSKSSDILDTVTECSIKYSDNLQVDPLQRLTLSMIQLALAVDSHNKARKMLDKKPSEPICNTDTSEIPQQESPEMQDNSEERRKKLMENL
jgi:hypothetical protein